MYKWLDGYMDSCMYVWMDGQMDGLMETEMDLLCITFYCHLHEISNMCRETDVISFSFSAHSSYIRRGIHIIIIFLKSIIIIYFIVWLFFWLFVCLYFRRTSTNWPGKSECRHLFIETYYYDLVFIVFNNKHIENFIVVMLLLLYCSKLWYY